MKRIGLLCLLLFAVSQLMAQSVTKKDSLLERFYNFQLQDKAFKMPNLSKLKPKDSLLNRLRSFKYPGTDSLTSFRKNTLLKSGVTRSSVDHMPVAVLPSNSRMPVYNMPRSTDKMPGSNPPNTAQAPVEPQK